MFRQRAEREIDAQHAHGCDVATVPQHRTDATTKKDNQISHRLFLMCIARV